MRTPTPILSFYGSKWRAAKYYPDPKYDLIVEPFAGGAGYALNHYDRNVVLVEKDPIIAAIWKFVIEATYNDIINLPILEYGQKLSEITQLSDEERWFIGFWLNKGNTHPCNSLSAWKEKFPNGGFWDERKRLILAQTVDMISHWRVVEGNYDSVVFPKATWFIDPPYQYMGKYYRYGSKDLNYVELAKWVLSLSGQVMVCEQEGADWLPFKPLCDVKATSGRYRKGTSKEVLYVQ